MSYKGLKKGQKRTLQKTLLGRSHWRIKEKVYDVGNNTLSCFLESIQVSNSNHERITLWFTIHFFMAHRRLIFLWNKILLYSLAVCRVGEAEEFRRHGGWVRGHIKVSVGVVKGRMWAPLGSTRVWDSKETKERDHRILWKQEISRGLHSISLSLYMPLWKSKPLLVSTTQVPKPCFLLRVVQT